MRIQAGPGWFQRCRERLSVDSGQKSASATTVARRECCGGRVRAQAEHREDGGIVLADGFRQPICYGVEIAEYPVVSGPSAGIAAGIGLSFRTDKQLLK